MPFWERFKPKENPRSTLQERSAKSPRDGVASSLRLFGLALLQQESARRPKQNIFISPLSIFLALAMTENGAAGETKGAIRKVLGLAADANEEEVNESAATLMKSLQSQGEAGLAIANALWIDRKARISPDFVRVCEKIYDAAANALDLSQPSSATTINDWVSKKTRGKIPSIVTPDGIRGLSAILTNALYFKGKFCNRFPKEATRPMAFHLTDGREKVVPMMRLTGLYGSYRGGTGFEAAVLRYEDSGIALCMLLPNIGTSPEEILTEESLEMLLKREFCELDLSMPRFAIDFDCQLRESLTRMGMGIAFQYPGADFSALGSPSFFLDEVVHKTRLEVDEEGTVAAAATTTMVTLGSGGPPRVKRKKLVFDRPFAAVLRDTVTDAIVFAGVVYDP